MKSADLKSERGFGLIEAMISGVIMTVGLLSLAYVYGQGLTVVMSCQQEGLARQKAREAMEDVLTARNNETLTWNQINNISNGGVFLDGPQPLTTPGSDGMVNTADDGPVETIIMPGPDGMLSDGVAVPLNGYKREIKITTISNVLKQITVTITYVTSTNTTGTYQLNCYISPYEVDAVPSSRHPVCGQIVSYVLRISPRHGSHRNARGAGRHSRIARGGFWLP